MNKKNIIWTIVAVVVAVGGFFGGMFYEKSHVKTVFASIGTMTAAQRTSALASLGVSGGNLGGAGGAGGAAGAAGRFGGRGAGGGAGGAAGASVANGSIISKDANSITVKLAAAPAGAAGAAGANTDSSAAGGSKIIYFGTSSMISKTDPGSLSDLQVGQDVFVTGTNNSDGSITAQNVQIRNMPTTTPAGQ